MGEKIGAEVWLERAPLKYEGLSYTEIWISEAQERMVLCRAARELGRVLARSATPKGSRPRSSAGSCRPAGCSLKYHGTQVGRSGHGVPARRPAAGGPRGGVSRPGPPEPLDLPANAAWTTAADLLRILGSLNVASKEWVIRQYDHEVQGGSVIKPLVGVTNDGPGDAAVLRPVLDSRRGLVIACGMNPRYGDLDPYYMAASAIDEAVRNCVAVGADPRRIAILDNFCWGNTDRPETLGSLVRAALACHDVAVALGTPFISGKDSLNNEFSYHGRAGASRRSPSRRRC